MIDVNKQNGLTILIEELYKLLQRIQDIIIYSKIIEAVVNFKNNFFLVRFVRRE